VPIPRVPPVAQRRSNAAARPGDRGQKLLDGQRGDLFVDHTLMKWPDIAENHGREKDLRYRQKTQRTVLLVVRNHRETTEVS
jgi:hypothetical protein